MAKNKINKKTEKAIEKVVEKAVKKVVTSKAFDTVIERAIRNTQQRQTVRSAAKKATGRNPQTGAPIKHGKILFSGEGTGRRKSWTGR